MQVKPRSYPHPVLSHFSDDIVGSVFQPVVTVKGVKNAYVFDATFKTNNVELLQMVKDKTAFNAVHVECVQTRYRNIFTSSAEKFSFNIPAGDIDGRVEVCSFLLAARPISAYRNSGFHPDYSKLTFGIRKADTLAVGQDREFIAERKSDPLRKVPSIFSIVPNDEPTATGIDIDTTGAKVIVRLSRKNFDAYANLRQSQALHPMLSAAIVVPSLVFVIEEIRLAATNNELEAYGDRRWFAVIARKLKDLNIDPRNPDSYVDSSLKIAHELVGQPLEASLSRLTDMESDVD